MHHVSWLLVLAAAAAAAAQHARTPAEDQCWPAAAVLLDEAVDVVVEAPLKQEVILCRCVTLDVRGQLAGAELVTILPQASRRH